MWTKGVLCAVMVLAPFTAVGREADETARRATSELAVGIFAHGIRRPFTTAPPDGADIYEGEEERGTADIQIIYRSAPLSKALKPRLTAKVQINTAGRTNFASLGAEWRQYLVHSRVYGQIGIGLTVQDGYRYTPDPFASGITSAEAARRFDIAAQRTGFGSRVLFNPNLSFGVRMSSRCAIEAAFEHFSHKRLFSGQNPGIDTIGVRLVHTLGKP